MKILITICFALGLLGCRSTGSKIVAKYKPYTPISIEVTGPPVLRGGVMAEFEVQITNSQKHPLLISTYDIDVDAGTKKISDGTVSLIELAIQLPLGPRIS